MGSPPRTPAPRPALRAGLALGAAMTGLLAVWAFEAPDGDTPRELARFGSIARARAEHAWPATLEARSDPDDSCAPGARSPTCDDERGVTLPTGDAPALECDEARTVIAQARAALAAPAEPIDAARFAVMTSDWLDPHGLWSVAPDAPTAAILISNGRALLDELEAAPGSGPCVIAELVGASLSPWVDDLREVIEASRTRATKLGESTRGPWEIASTTPFEDGPVRRSGRELARSIGEGLGHLTHAYGPDVEGFGDLAAYRAAPHKSTAAWAQVVLAAGVRAYVPQIDPHGAWAPLDEETSIYDLDLEMDPPERLWAEMTRTVLGVRIDRGAKAPLQDGDVVIEVAGLSLGGLSVEQANQVAVLPPKQAAAVKILRAGSPRPIALDVEPSAIPLAPEPALDDHRLKVRRVPYGKGDALVVRIPDVPDDLGDALSFALEDARRQKEPVGVLLDLRDNGGGSTDGALAALGLFLPGAALFPMRRRDGAIEIDRAPLVPPELAWQGPVAALVDGNSASAAEMIAGALASYRRGIVVGSRTYGKGCAQEYIDDDTRRGVLRLTTLVFCLPDGAPLQRVGVSPHISLGLPASSDREALLPRAPIAWHGPDVRDPLLVQDVPWPDHAGRVGVIDDATVYRALRALGASRAAAR